ncbi:MAG: hypothetical protein A3D52_02390 [Candidatus Taylorbacteria bacterium RIFCSPHIGHO2_02_FULL_44_36]|uniref:Prepilin-type N-terminal cleavage/methylation domain-containing protein n=1 Tax=Candidatus Taylorbacteria bacterium RIFCSPLOWO2_12_FULL_44_15c TaxID=1802333 RepID=A0A1G2P7X5_9BACT|nr:MAG: hypothetical protein A3D52_02390 [Candidatus Taylorbacteria bacterium RIFCSPHIGHO2_02_FULL_44_36]OHA37798.1 MAG: hypothetical protein A3I97_02675 [Candidatus Taylorbacteria bacterium RIFCSPLOWO2_02_FULL_44_35]OHA44465.1 MAG: hypothetical protein A3G03_01870 [Candidatus Taylorbacteria bacterium RIFCSPLOWO2_12_FULL_44_15c]
MNNQGFSLVEILVSTAIFSVVMITAAGALLTTIDANHKAQAIQSVMNNLNFALESMSRAIRVGDTYHCGSIGVLSEPRDCSSGDIFFAFKRSSDSKAVYYYLSGSQIVRGVNGEALAITAPEIMIENLKFYVQGAGVGSQAQPRVTIVIRGYAGATAKIRTPFNLQTTLSQRMPK